MSNVTFQETRKSARLRIIKDSAKLKVEIKKKMYECW